MADHRSKRLKVGEEEPLPATATVTDQGSPVYPTKSTLDVTTTTQQKENDRHVEENQQLTKQLQLAQDNLRFMVKTKKQELDSVLLYFMTSDLQQELECITEEKADLSVKEKVLREQLDEANKLMAQQKDELLAMNQKLEQQNQQMQAYSSKKDQPDSVDGRAIDLSGRAIDLSGDRDAEMFSEYHCQLRKQIEFFQTSQEDMEGTRSTCSKPIVLNQVGIRCKHCKTLPVSERGRRAISYPRTIQTIYPMVLTMSKHFLENCPKIPPAIRQTLEKLAQDNRYKKRGSTMYWSDGIQEIGIQETDNGLTFSDRDQY